jgi:hypothetical protein
MSQLGEMVMQRLPARRQEVKMPPDGHSRKPGDTIDGITWGQVELELEESR